MNSIRTRWLARNLESALRVLPVTVVTGARQTGKTTLVKSVGPSRAYFTLDDVGVLDQAERNPDALLGSRPVTLDEVQRTPSLLLAVKRAVDERRRKLHFWRDRPGHEVDFILEQNGKLVALEIKAGSTVTSSDAAGIRAFRDSLKKKSVLVRSAVLHAGRARPLDTDILALPWGWVVAAD